MCYVIDEDLLLDKPSVCPSFVQSLSLFKWVSRAKQSLPVISLEIPVRPSVVDKNQTLGNLAQVTIEGANPQTSTNAEKMIEQQAKQPLEDRT